MAKTPSPEYIEKAKQLSREEAERILARLKKKYMRRLEDQETGALEVVALQLQKDDEDLQEWRERWAEIKSKEK